MSALLAPGTARPVENSPRQWDRDGFFAHHGPWAPGVRLFRRIGFTTKAVIISLAFLVPLLFLVGWLLEKDADDSMRARMDATRQHVEVAYSVLEWAHAQEVGGQMSHEAAQAAAIGAIRQLRYDTKEYFWINDMQPRMIMHPIKPELDGKDLSGLKDPNGFALFQEMVNTVRRDGKGFVAYQWPKPGSEHPVDKISYVAGFAPWGWVVGSGVYTGDLREAAREQMLYAAAIVLGALAVAGYLFLSFYRVMNGGLKETRRHLSAMASGDLTSAPSPWGRDEAAELMLDLRHMQQSLIAVVRRVRASGDQILNSSGEVATASLNLSKRTEQAASNLETAAASMSDLTQTVVHGSQLSDEASKVARHNAEVAADGGRVMREVISTMDAIRGSSSRISEIIGAIDSIAFQTNILALNAAVEAARAGDQGRGFAVVASEVRALAQRSAQAAKEIRDLIHSSVGQVADGAQRMEKASETISRTVSAVYRVGQMIQEITNATSEQSVGIVKVNEAIAELDRATQANAMLVQQTAAAADALNDRTAALKRSVQIFQM